MVCCNSKAVSLWFALATLIVWGIVPVVTRAATFEVGQTHAVVGDVRVATAKHQDTLLAIAEEFELGYEELVAANPKIDSWIPGEGSRILLPSKFIVPQKMPGGIYINLAEYRLYYFPVDEGHHFSY